MLAVHELNLVQVDVTPTSDLQTIAEELSRSNILEIWNDKHLLYLWVLADLVVEDGDP